MNRAFFTQIKLSRIALFVLMFGMSISGVFAQATYQGNNFFIPQAPPATSGAAFGTVDVACVGTVTNGANITLQVNLAHTFMGDLNMWLIAPGGQVLELSTRNGAGNNNMNVNFSDAGATNIASAVAVVSAGVGCPTTTHAYSGTFRPEGRNNVVTAFNVAPSNVPAVGTFTFANTFSGINANGTWTLRADDGVGGDLGQTCSWSISFAGVVVPTCTIVGGPTLPTLNLSTSTENCQSDPITVPAVTSTDPAGCTNAIRSYSLDGGPFITLMPGQTTIPPLPGGPHTIIWRVVNSCLQVNQATQTINVSDQVDPGFTGCEDIIINLAPGECTAPVSFNVVPTDNCPFIGPMGTLSSTPGASNNGNAANGVVFFDVENLTPDVITVTAMSSSIDAASMINVYRKSGTGFGFEQNIGAWTLVSVGDASTGPFGPAVNTPFTVNFELQPGVNGIALNVVATGSNYTNGTGVNGAYGNSPNGTFTNGTLTIRAGATSNGPAFGPAPFNPRIWLGSLTYETFSGGELLQTSGLPSGSLFPIGTTTNCFSTEDGAGNIGTCCFDVTVNEYSGPILQSLACNDLVQISLDENCTAVIGADVVLEGGPYACYDDYIVEVQTGAGVWVPAVLGPQHVGQLINVRVTDPVTGNTCWGQLLVEDKIPPVLECLDFTFSCGEDLTPVFTPPIMGTFNCSQSPNAPLTGVLNSVVESTCNVNLPAGVEILDVNVCVDILHGNIGNLAIQLVSPTGGVTQLWGTVGVCGQCFGAVNMHLSFDDQGPAAGLCAAISAGSCALVLQPVALQNVPACGVPSPSLGQYNAQNPNGGWTLRVIQSFAGGVGTLEFWSIDIAYAQNAPFAPTVSDNCDNNVTLTYEDVPVGELCDTIEILRTWTGTDDSGNAGTCIQTLTVVPLNLDLLECPENYEGDCGQSTDPAFTGGYPSVDGVPVVEGGTCNIFVGYWDKPLDDCGNGTKIIRTWTILDWCTQETVECVQVIKLTDTEGPWLECPADVTVGSDPWFCNRDVILELPVAEDHCGTPFSMTPSVPAGVLVHFGGNFWRVDDLPVGTHTITWTAIDDCGNVSTCEYDITVVDDVPPVPNCDEHTILGITFDNGLDEGLTKIYATTFDDGSYDNCGPVTFLVRRMDSCIDFDWIGPNGEYPNNDGGQPESVDRGLTFQEWVPFACCDVNTTVMVELRVTDLSGNINSCMVEVEIQDKLPPLIVCPPDITVSCDFWFDAHPTDGFQPTDGLEGVFGRVLDAYDFDESDREYVIVDDPGNDDLPQPYHWGLDGWADDNCDVTIDVRTRLFDDCSGEDLPGGAPDFAVRLVERTFRAQDAQGNTSTCRQRIWVVDFDPFYITDTQCGLNNADDVRWPCDLVLTDCPQGELTPENLSDYAPNNRPIVNDDNCSIIGVSYEDQIFYFVDNACYKIVREWTVIDWCQFEDDGEGGHYGYWTYIQVIKVHDEDGAEFLDCPDGPLTYCVADPNVELPSNNQVFLGEGNPNSSSCSVHVWEERTVYETCSDIVIYDVKIYPFNGSEFVQIVEKTEVDVDSNGQAVLTWDTRQNSLPSNHPIRRYGLPYNDRFCSNWPLPGGSKDYHRVLWSVEDGCGNLSTCEYLFRLEDCKQPTPICVGLSSVVMPSSGSVTIWAKDFDSGSTVDDCTAHDDLLFSFSGTNYEPSRVFDCASIEANGSPSFLVEIWVADEGNDQNCNGFVQPLGIEYSERNKDFCTTFIVIDDNEDVCPGGPGIGGTIETEELQTVELVTVNLIDPVTGALMQNFNTSSNGFYQFINLNPLLSYEVKAARDDNHKNGVSTLDLVKIQKHLLGIELLDSPYKLIAADANSSESVSALDLVDIRKLILGLYSEFPKNESWRFVASDFTFSDPSNPWPFAEVMESHGMMMDHDFIGVKIGDVNGNVQANATQIQTRNAKGVLEFNTAAQTVVAGQTLSVPVSAKNFTQILGYQFTMNTAGLNLSSVEAGALDMSAENVGVHANAITVSWNKISAVSSSDVLFTLNFTATASGELSKMLSITSNAKLTEAEAYNGKEEVLDVALSFGTAAAAGKDYALFQNNPNPFEGSTVIGFTLPEAMDATVTVYDVTGKVIHAIEGAYTQGYNEVKVNRKDLVAAGVMYYRLDANDFTATKKMVVID